MTRRLTLSTKLLAATLPLLVAIAVLLALMVRNDLRSVSQAENGARLGSIWTPLVDALDGVEDEVRSAAAPDTMLPADVAAARSISDQAFVELRTAIDELDSRAVVAQHLDASRDAVSAARRAVDAAASPADIAPDERFVNPVNAYELAIRELISIGRILPAEAGDRELGSTLLATVSLADARLHANRVIADVFEWREQPTSRIPLRQAQQAFFDMETALGQFVASAPDQWLAQYEASGFSSQIAMFGQQLDGVLNGTEAGMFANFDIVAFEQLVDQGVGFQRSLTQSIVDESATDVDSTRSATLIRLAIVLGTVVIAAGIAVWITRSLTRRIREVADGATQVAEKQLPALVAALSDDSGNASIPEVAPLKVRGADELSELATSFNQVQTTLIDVANEQVEVLRRGVSDIFVTMARRNRSLIDRQLAMLDEYEAEVDDPEILSNYYQLDHLATRMRRNSESLLVLANAEPKRRRVKATEIDDVVRASISEVEDYRRIQIEALESLQVKGNVVADISHLLAELFDNATSFSPPGSPVRVGGRRVGNAYVIRIVDDGVGIGPDRLDELNAILKKPPVIGLSASTTLGMSVVSLLAAKHGIAVTLAPGATGLTVDVILPSNLFGPIEETYGGAAPSLGGTAAAAPASGAPASAPAGAPASFSYESSGGGPNYDILKQPEPTPEPTPEPATSSDHYDPFADDERRVVASDLSSLSSSLAAFRSGMQSASGDAEQQAPDETFTPAATPEPAAAPPAAAPAPAPAAFDPGPAPAAPPPPTTPVAPAPASEFSVPPAPPMNPSGPSQLPVAPGTARPAPRVDATPDDPLLPTRSPGAQGDVGGPDRIADGLTGGSEPGALSAALAAFDSPRQTATQELPSRPPENGPIDALDDPTSVAKSQLDPDAFRERLRSFQSEFTTGRETGDTPNEHPDLGGDPR